MWEYNKFVFKYENSNKLVENLNEIGDNNWEIISVNEKKPKKYGEDWECEVLVKRLKETTNVKKIL